MGIVDSKKPLLLNDLGPGDDGFASDDFTLVALSLLSSLV
jgi:hypothetical protein